MPIDPLVAGQFGRHAMSSMRDTASMRHYKSRVPKWLKLIIAILLLPICGGAVGALIRVVRSSGAAETVWVVLVGGAACWVVVYLLLPKPMLVYVFGHELTHALWAWLFGGKVKRFKFSANG